MEDQTKNKIIHMDQLTMQAKLSSPTTEYETLATRDFFFINLLT